MTVPVTTPLEPGTLVVCTYRFPSVNQPWIHEFHVGVIETPGTNRNEWNGYNSEEDYCNTCHYARMRYEWNVMHEARDCLIPITAEQARLSHREKVTLFLGEEALRQYDRAMHIR
jgi:hypothetical protein